MTYVADQIRAILARSVEGLAELSLSQTVAPNAIMHDPNLVQLLFEKINEASARSSAVGSCIRQGEKEG